MADKGLYKSALEYHQHPKPGKLAIVATKPLANQRDLSLAYSPGVAAACEEIAREETTAAKYTARSNLVAVISNGTAVLGLGDIGPLASKPVMEGKAVLFKQFAGLDVFDIEINEKDPDRLVDIIVALEPTFGAINLEDIKAPECFDVERKLIERLKIPVFHDDQHGTAIIVAAAVLNGLHLVGKKIEDVRLVTSGAGASAMACLALLEGLGLKRENVIATDRAGVIHTGRSDLDEQKTCYARDTSARTLEEAVVGADIFLGLSVGNKLTTDMAKSLAKDPLILALANPTPEIDPNIAKKVRPDAIIATGRSDHPNQVNNVLCFPFIFRGALDVGATVINDEMKKACVRALAELAKAEPSDVVARAYGGESIGFGSDYIIPKPFDPRLMSYLAPAVAQAAMDSGVATRPIKNFDAYGHQLESFVYRTGLLMKSVFAKAKKSPRRVVFSEGEDKRVLRAVQMALDEGFIRPILIGRRDVVSYRIEQLGLRFKLDEDVELTDPQEDPRFKEYWQGYHQLMQRSGITPERARTTVRTNTTVIGALMVRRGEADALVAGPADVFEKDLKHVQDVIGLAEGVRVPASLNAMVLDKGTFFFCDAYVNVNPTAEQLADVALQASEQVKRFGLEPKVGLLSHSNFGSRSTQEAAKMSEVVRILHEKEPNLEVEGEMQADVALNPALREHILPNSKLEGQANLLVMPNLDAANIAFNLLKEMGGGQPLGPILLGMDKVVHILTSSATSRGILNMAALAVVEAQISEGSRGTSLSGKAENFSKPSSLKKTIVG